MKPSWKPGRSCYGAIDDFDQKRALALIVSGKLMNDTLMSLKQELRSLGFKLWEGEVDSYEDYKPDLAPIFATAFAYARHELGIVCRCPSKEGTASARF